MHARCKDPHHLVLKAECLSLTFVEALPWWCGGSLSAKLKKMRVYGKKNFKNPMILLGEFVV